MFFLTFLTYNDKIDIGRDLIINVVIIMNSLLLVIDLQNSFINENTKNVPNNISNLIIKNKFNYIAFTKFVNDIHSQFYKILGYKGCINAFDRRIVIDTKNNKIFEKRIYTAFNQELVQFIKANNISIIYLCGIDTDACVLKTAIDLFENNYNVKVIEDCSMSHSGKEFHEYAIKMLEKLIGKQNVVKML